MMGSPAPGKPRGQPAGGRFKLKKLGINGTLGELRNVAQSAAKGCLALMLVAERAA